MKYPSEEVMIAKVKEWFGWDDDMIKMVKTANGLQLVYRIMMKESKEHGN